MNENKKMYLQTNLEQGRMDEELEHMGEGQRMGVVVEEVVNKERLKK